MGPPPQRLVAPGFGQPIDYQPDDGMLFPHALSDESVWHFQGYGPP